MIRFAQIAMGAYDWIRHFMQRCGWGPVPLREPLMPRRRFRARCAIKIQRPEGTGRIKRDQQTSRRNEKSQEGLSNVAPVFRVATSPA
jgi:hypothetical protein